MQPAGALEPGCEEMERESGNEEETKRESGNEGRMREWRVKGERMRKLREIQSHCLFISSRSIHFLYQICHTLSQGIKYGTFVTNVMKI